MANSRISDLQKKTVLYSTGVSDSADDDALFLIAREKSHNETINYEDLKQSITDYSVNTTGDQLIGGEKTFEDNSFFNSDVEISGNLNVDGSLSVKGDIFNLKFDDGSGGDADQYLTQLDSNLFTKGNQEVDGDSNLKGELTVLGGASFIDVTAAGDTELKGKLGVSGDVDLQGKVGASGDATLTNLLVTGDTILEGALNTKGQTTLDQDLQVLGKILSPTVQGDTVLEGALTTKGEATLEQNLQVQGVISGASVESAKLFINQPEITISADEDGDEEGNIVFNTSGTEKARIKGSDFGIGTSTPLKKLDVAGDINLSGDIYKGNVLMPIGEWETAGTNDIYFNRGKVGIGLTIPTELLDVAGNAKFSGDIIGEGDVYVGGKLLFNNIYPLETDLPSANTYHGMFAHVHDTGKAYYSHAGDWLALVNATSDGKVGIGTSFPDEALHIEGNVKVTGDLVGISGFTATGVISGDIFNANEINIQSDINILTDGILTLHGTNSKIVAPKIEAGDIEADQIEVTGDHLTVSGIDSKVGIGISSDLEARLHVVGESKFNGLVNFESAIPILDITDTDQPINSNSLSGLINFNTNFSGTKENFGSIGYADTDNKLKIINTLDGVEFLAAGDTNVKGGELTVEDSGGTLKLNISPNAIRHTKDNGGFVISAQGSNNDLHLMATGEIKLSDGGNNPILIVDGATGDTLVKGNLTVEGNLAGGSGAVELDELDIETSIKYKGDDFPAGPRKIGTDFGGETVTAPAGAHAAGSVNDFIFEDEYAYICVVDSDGTDPSKKAWKRFPISDW